MITGPPLTLLPADLLAGLRGNASGGVRVEIPLEGEIARGSVHSTADVKLSDVTWTDSPVPLGDRELRDGVLDLYLDDDSLEVRGEIKLGGIPIRVDYRENLTSGEPERRVVAHAVIDDAARKALDLPEQNYFSGSTSLDMTYIGRRDGTSRIEAEVDLLETVLEIPEMAWSKASGEAGHASGVLELTDESWTLAPFEIDAGGLKANGSLDLAPDPTELRNLKLERVKFGRSDFRATLALDPTTGLRLRVEGPAFDAVPLIDYLKKVKAETAQERRAGDAAPPKDRPPFDIGIRLDELRIAEGSHLNGVITEVVYDGRSVSKVVSHAEMISDAHTHTHSGPESEQEVAEPGNSKLDLSYLPKGNGHELRFETDNLGMLVQGLHVSTAIRGGTVLLTMTRPAPDEPAEGQLAIREFTVVDLPNLAKVLELGSLRGISDGLSEGGLWVKKVSAKLSANDREITIADGKALGHGFGITIRGTVDFNTNVLDLEGAVTPMETVQRVIGHIPLIGRLLAGWNREGIIAVLYDVKGPMENPDFKVNGYSALTPGITREIFRLAPDDDEEDASGDKHKKGNNQEISP
jgi:hypothetical protein